MSNNSKDNPLITVFILVYNNESGMRQTIDSVISQTYENIQVIISDDGSNNYDNDTLSVYADELKKKYSNEKIVEIYYDKLRNIPKIKNTNVISNEHGVIKIKIDAKKTTVSNVAMEYSKVCEIKDINVLNSPIDDIIYKLYEDYEI